MNRKGNNASGDIIINKSCRDRKNGPIQNIHIIVAPYNNIRSNQVAVDEPIQNNDNRPKMNSTFYIAVVFWCKRPCQRFMFNLCAICCCFSLKRLHLSTQQIFCCAFVLMCTKNQGTCNLTSFRFKPTVNRDGERERVPGLTPSYRRTCLTSLLPLWQPL